MPTIEETHQNVKTATRNTHLWDNTVAGSLNHGPRYENGRGLIWYDGRIYVPRDHALHGEIIARSHDHITAGHLGIEKPKNSYCESFGGQK